MHPDNDTERDMFTKVLLVLGCNLPMTLSAFVEYNGKAKQLFRDLGADDVEETVRRYYNWLYIGLKHPDSAFSAVDRRERCQTRNGEA